MKEDLLKYMIQRSKRASTRVTTGGPLVTISREKGCPANSIADKLAERLSGEVPAGKWRWVTKEIIEKTAKELHINPSKVNHAIHHEDKGFFTDLILSFGEKYYESDEAIKKTIGELVQEFASKGQVIIVGLGGVALTRDIEKSLHVKLFAPEKYRHKEVIRHEGMKAEEAREYMRETDINRQMLIDYFNEFKAHDDLFHVQFNCAKMSKDEIVDSIIEMMKKRRLF